MAKKTNKQLEQEVARLQEELSEQIAENGILTEKYGLVNGELAGLKVQYKRVVKEKDKQFKTITNYEKELEEQDKEIEELKEENHDLDTMVVNMKERIKELEEQKKDDWRLEQYNELNTKLRKTREKIREQNGLIVELKEELENYSGIKIEKKQDTFVISKTANQDLVDTLQKELQSQIILKNTYKKENKRLKKRRREGRYNPKKVYEKLARGWLCYIPEGDYLPTKVHESLIDAMEEGHRLADKTKNTVYIVGTYCKI